MQLRNAEEQIITYIQYIWRDEMETSHNSPGNSFPEVPKQEQSLNSPTFNKYHSLGLYTN